MAPSTDESTYTWDPEHEGVLSKLADTNIVSNTWAELKPMLQYLIKENVKDLVEHKIPMSYSHLPPPPELGEELLVEFPVRIMPKDMDQASADAKTKDIFELMDAFEEQPPFTIQRLTELALRPRDHYNAVGKYLRALERTLVVTSTADEYRTDTYIDDPSSPNATFLASNQALAHATTPLFSPIPFLAHAHSSRGGSSSGREGSRSPTSTLGGSPLALDERNPLPGDDTTSEGVVDENAPPSSSGSGGMSPAQVRALRVDELDHVSPPSSPPLVPSSIGADDLENLSPSKRAGHLAEHPEPFSTTTTMPRGGGALGLGGLGLPHVEGRSGRSPPPPTPPTRSGAPSPPTISERAARAKTPEPSPTRILEEAKRVKAENAAASSGGKNEDQAEEGEVEDVIMQDS